ncbi:hypothetical protein BIZ83_gp211 [Erwinia phage vB_EamM_ChrisDB]|uniref:hypothetical protein n=1 Tax=Erwinia phage vB_EamM_ChrisDB TaxID=1883371 RepID=UPI00081C5E8C|nr:hypothetical protein BIZ83_gp211 [Erwinia phage vB_EamM_ChrisDB]ANZ48642.1 hypothetical protein CHRISDB_80 [Erwinia phage vB_EamM_ChrisDB]
MSTLRQSYQPLEDGSDTSNKIIAQLDAMDKRKKIVDEMMTAVKAGDSVKANELRNQLFTLN